MALGGHCVAHGWPLWALGGLWVALGGPCVALGRPLDGRGWPHAWPLGGPWVALGGLLGAFGSKSASRAEKAGSRTLRGPPLGPPKSLMLAIL